jgi:hypothetical protein
MNNTPHPSPMTPLWGFIGGTPAIIRSLGSQLVQRDRLVQRACDGCRVGGFGYFPLGVPDVGFFVSHVVWVVTLLVGSGASAVGFGMELVCWLALQPASTVRQMRVVLRVRRVVRLA